MPGRRRRGGALPLTAPVGAEHGPISRSSNGGRSGRHSSSDDRALALVASGERGDESESNERLVHDSLAARIISIQFYVIPGRPEGPSPEPINNIGAKSIATACFRLLGDVGVYGFRAHAFGMPRNDR